MGLISSQSSFTEGHHIKLVLQLLEGWKEIYPSTDETVMTFQTRIKHMSQQKEVIKKYLGNDLTEKVTEINENVEETVEEEPNIEGFEGWTIHMIRDFVACMDVTRKKFSRMKEKDPGTYLCQCTHSYYKSSSFLH